MALGIGRTMPSQARPADVWILGRRQVSGPLQRPVVFHKPAGARDFVVKYIGDDVPSDRSLSFIAGVRNRKDAPGVISLLSDVNFTGGGNDNGTPAVQAFKYARSIDSGASWTYPGIVSSTTDVQSEVLSFPLRDDIITYASNDVQMLDRDVFSPEPGVVYALGKYRRGFQDTIPPGTLRRYYEYDLCLLASVDGGPMQFVTSIAPMTRYDTAYYPLDDVRFYELDVSIFGGIRETAPRAIFTGQSPTPPSRMVSVELHGTRRDPEDRSPLYEYSYVTIGIDSVSTVSGLPYGDPLTSGGPPRIIVWDGKHFYYGGITAAGVRKMVRSTSAFGPWSEVFTGGTGNFTCGAARRPGHLYVSGKGVTTDGGQTWTSGGLTLTRVGFFGTQYYGYSGTTVYRSNDGINWEVVTLPTVSGLSQFWDIFGG